MNNETKTNELPEMSRAEVFALRERMRKAELEAFGVASEAWRVAYRLRCDIDAQNMRASLVSRPEVAA